MDSTNPKVDAFLSKAEKWQQAFGKLRAIALDCQLTEEFKWGVPCYTYQGKNVVLVRDLTDTMYNPNRSPRVDHFTGTDLVIEHIEKYWCPTITSTDVLGGKPFRFKNDTRTRRAGR